MLHVTDREIPSLEKVQKSPPAESLYGTSPYPQKSHVSSHSDASIGRHRHPGTQVFSHKVRGFRWVPFPFPFADILYIPVCWVREPSVAEPSGQRPLGAWTAVPALCHFCTLSFSLSRVWGSWRRGRLEEADDAGVTRVGPCITPKGKMPENRAGGLIVRERSEESGHKKSKQQAFALRERSLFPTNPLSRQTEGFGLVSLPQS